MDIKDKRFKQFLSTDVSLINNQQKYSGYLKLHQLTLSHKRFQGGTTEDLQREVVVRGQGVGLLPYDPINDKIVLIEQFRPGVYMGDLTTSPWTLEIIAGMVGPGEDLAEVAKREAFEEAGLVVNEVTPITSFWVSPGISTEKMNLFYTEIDSRNVGGVHGLAHEGEDIKVWVLDASEVFEMVDKGLICNAHTLISLYWLRLKKCLI